MLDIQEDVAYVMSLLKLELKSKLEAQGHGSRNASKLIDSVEFDITASANILVAGMYLEDYYIFVERGVNASRIPYGGRGTGRGGTSKYIQALIRYWRLKRGLPEKEAKRAAFATANKHKEEGMPTRSSFRFSKDGTRLGFVESTLKTYESRVAEILEQRIGNNIDTTLTNILNQVAVNLN